MQSLNLRRSFELYERGLHLMPGASQTNSKRPTSFALGAFPMFIEKGRGARVWDADGNEYIDYILGLGPITLGYGYEPVDAAAHAQIDKGVVFGLMSTVEVEAAEAVVSMIPSADQVRFFKTGAETTAAAVRVARAYTGRDIVLHHGYHGWLDSVNATQEQPGMPQCFRDVLLPFGWNDPEGLRRLLEEHKGKVAALLMNPVDYFKVEDGAFLRQLRALCDEYGVLLLFDEIVTGYRMANGGAQEYFDVTPDLGCFAKGIANGYPVGALCGRREVMAAMEDAVISSTYGGEAVSLAALVASHQVYREHDVPAFLARQGNRLMDGFNAAMKKHAVRGRCFGYAPMSAIAFDYDDEDTNRHCMTYWLQESAKRGVLLRRGGLNCITFSHTDEIIDATIAVADEVLHGMAKAVAAGNLAGLLETKADLKGLYER